MLFQNWKNEIWNDNGVDVSWESERGVYFRNVIFFYLN